MKLAIVEEQPVDTATAIKLIDALTKTQIYIAFYGGPFECTRDEAMARIKVYAFMKGIHIETVDT